MLDTTYVLKVGAAVSDERADVKWVWGNLINSFQATHELNLAAFYSLRCQCNCHSCRPLPSDEYLCVSLSMYAIVRACVCVCVCLSLWFRCKR